MGLQGKNNIDESNFPLTEIRCLQFILIVPRVHGGDRFRSDGGTLDMLLVFLLKGK